MEIFDTTSIELAVNTMYAAPEFKTVSNKKWVAYIDTDGLQYPEKLQYYKNNSALHGALVKNIARQYAGAGLVIADASVDATLVANTNSFLDNINAKGEDANELLGKMAYDFKLYGGFAVAVVWAKDYSKIVSVEHVDFSKLRVGICDAEGNVPGFYYAWSWKSQRPETIFIPAFSEKVASEQNSKYKELKSALDLGNNNLDKMTEFFSAPTTQILYYKPYESGSFYYPYPDYVGGINAILANILIDQYGVSSMENGLTVDYIVKFIGNYDEASKIKEAQAFLKQHANALKKRRPIIAFAKDKDTMMQIDNISGINEDKSYTKINENSISEIVMSHSVTSPLLVGIKTPGQLGGGQELIDAEVIFYKNTIAPGQNTLAKVFNKILKINKLADVKVEKLSVLNVNSEIANEQQNN